VTLRKAILTEHPELRERVARERLEALEQLEARMHLAAIEQFDGYHRGPCSDPHCSFCPEAASTRERWLPVLLPRAVARFRGSS